MRTAAHDRAPVSDMVTLRHKTAVPYRVHVELVAAEMRDVTRTRAERRQHSLGPAVVWWYPDLPDVY